jgi:serine/threonine protein phosphatase PrpC
MTLALRYAVRSDVGLLREGNEDSAYAGPRLLAVADGMGGHAAGEVASAVAIEALTALDGDLPASELLDALAGAVTRANDLLRKMVAANPSIGGMGTTLTAMLWSGTRVALCHIGDSRAYLLSGGEFKQITHDHTLVQSLVDDGRISPDEAATHPQRSLLLRALDGSSDVEPDLSMREAQTGDRYLLCSDGLSGVVSEPTLHRALATAAEPDDAVRQLVELAIKEGGPDNITCIVADVVDSATAVRPPSEVSVLAGAASNGSGMPMMRSDSTIGRGHVLTQTAPQAAIVIAHDDPVPRAAGGAVADDDTEPDGQVRRRLPIVKSLLALLLIVIIGAGYAGWRYTQAQYYVGEDAGRVTIFRGINQNVAGLKLSSVYDRTEIPLAGVPVTEQGLIRSTISANSLSHARSIVANIRTGYLTCQAAYARLSAYQARMQAYTAALNAYKKKHGTTAPVKTKTGKIVAKPPAKPAGAKPIIPTECPVPGAAPGTGTAP